MYINTHTRHPQKMPKKVIKLIICWLKGGNLVVRTSDTGMRGLLFTIFFFYLWCISYSANLKRQNENQKTLLPRYWGFWVLPKPLSREDFTSAVCSSLSLPCLCQGFLRPWVPINGDFPLCLSNTDCEVRPRPHVTPGPCLPLSEPQENRVIMVSDSKACGEA